MNEPSPQYLAPGQDVLVVGHDKKAHRAKVAEVLSPTAIRAESLDGKSTALCEYSETKEVNTFHFPASATASEKAGKTKEAN